MKIKFITSILLLFNLMSYSQSIDERKIDEFTGDTILSTKWEKLYYLNGMYSYKFRKVNENIFLNMKIMKGSPSTVISVSKDDKFMLKLANGDIITLLNLENKVSCMGCGATGFGGSGAMGIELTYYVEKEQLIQLRKSNVILIRIYTSDGYLEEKINPDKATLFNSVIDLILK